MFCKISSITEILYGINSNEALKSSLSKAAFPVYYGDWLFNLQMTQYMEYNTHYNNMRIDHDSFSNKRKLYGVTTLKKVIENKIHFQILFADNFHPINIDN